MKRTIYFLSFVLTLAFMTSCEKVYEETTIYTGSSQLYLMTTPTSSGEEKDLSVVFYAIDKANKKGIKVDTVNVSYNSNNKKWTPDLGVLSNKYVLVHCAYDYSDSIWITCEGKTTSLRGYTYGEKRLIEIAFNQESENGVFGTEEHPLEMEDRLVIID